MLTSGLDTPFVASLVTAVAHAGAAAGHDVLIDPMIGYEDRSTGGVLELLQQLTDGVIAVLPYEHGFVQTLSRARIPVVTIDHAGAHGEFPSLAADSYGGTRAAMIHLAKLGHHCIAFIGGGPGRAAWRRTVAQTHEAANRPLGRPNGIRL